MKEFFQRVAAFFIYWILRVLLLPQYFGAPGYLLIGFMGFIFLNILAVFSGLIQLHWPEFFLPPADKTLVAGFISDGEEICRLLK